MAVGTEVDPWTETVLSGWRVAVPQGWDAQQFGVTELAATTDDPEVGPLALRFVVEILQSDFDTRVGEGLAGMRYQLTDGRVIDVAEFAVDGQTAARALGLHRVALDAGAVECLWVPGSDGSVLTVVGSAALLARPTLEVLIDDVASRIVGPTTPQQEGQQDG